ncbi:DNA-processing protein DprA [Scleromatobacter humisilvae]|uniref:DNA-processing protein DprA n=1 Tax=Scleromatobacter humisilvae TaxID=2897159 RepID=A0A9X1YIU2_9BURK|nr:DNA-processing protein DprA [Scleromatobacter humisilvae]MCK9685513.1 DNA-processing protein DprA [Scleromatobacter humisilvae]
MLSQDELAAWLRLACTPGIGRATARKLLAALGSAERVLAADDPTLLSLTGRDVVRVLRRREARDDALVAATRRWLDASADDEPRDIVTLGDPRYPTLLLETADPPLLLFTLGRVELLSAQSVAIVGSRNATPQGVDNARAFARALSERGLAIVSGLAMGVDGAAHEGGLDGPGSTVAFVGTGLDRCYPSSHRALMRRIARNGLVASEYPLGAIPLPDNFPRRNRLIAGLSRGTLVVEAALESGSLITARMAVESGRDVFAIPGSIHSQQSQGCHRLIQEGAKLVENADDVLRELRFGPLGETRRATLSPARPSLFATATDDGIAAGPDGALRAALGHDPVTFDALAARTGMPSDQLAARLLDLELAGVVERLPGGLLQRRALA